MTTVKNNFKNASLNEDLCKKKKYSVLLSKLSHPQFALDLYLRAKHCKLWLVVEEHSEDIDGQTRLPLPLCKREGDTSAIERKKLKDWKTHSILTNPRFKWTSHLNLGSVNCNVNTNQVKSKGQICITHGCPLDLTWFLSWVHNKYNIEWPLWYCSYNKLFIPVLT